MTATPDPAPSLGERARGWLSRWRGGSPAIDEHRWVVVDVETSGLDAHHDRLLAIAGIAVALDGGRQRIALGDSFEVVLHQAADAPVDKPNILLHGIGVGAQRRGCDPAQALDAFQDWVGASPLIAFHAAFDETMIQRAMQALRSRRLPGPWVDLAHVAEVLRPATRARSLDQWMDALGIVCAARHQASADTLATAELLLQLWPDIAREAGSHAPGYGTLQRLAAQRRWVTGQGG